MNIKKTLISAVVSLMMAFSLESCITPAEAQVTVGSYPSVEVVISDGIPYIVDNTVIYWYYGDRYWYPYYIDGHRYLRPYAVPHRHHPYAHRIPPHHHRPVAPPHHRHYNRPVAPPHHAHAGHHAGPHRGSPGGHRGHFGGRR